MQKVMWSRRILVIGVAALTQWASAKAARADQDDGDPEGQPNYMDVKVGHFATVKGYDFHLPMVGAGGVPRLFKVEGRLIFSGTTGEPGFIRPDAQDASQTTPYTILVAPGGTIEFDGTERVFIHPQVTIENHGTIVMKNDRKVTLPDDTRQFGTINLYQDGTIDGRGGGVIYGDLRLGGTTSDGKGFIGGTILLGPPAGVQARIERRRGLFRPCTSSPLGSDLTVVGNIDLSSGSVNEAINSTNYGYLSSSGTVKVGPSTLSIALTNTNGTPSFPTGTAGSSGNSYFPLIVASKVVITGLMPNNPGFTLGSFTNSTTPPTMTAPFCYASTGTYAAVPPEPTYSTATTYTQYWIDFGTEAGLRDTMQLKRGSRRRLFRRFQHLHKRKSL